MGRTVTPATHRCFLGIELPAPVRRTLATLAAEWRPRGLAGSWVREANFHITVRFLGDLTNEQLAMLAALARPRFAALTRPSLQVSGTGAFPSARKPRVVWAGIRVHAGDLEALFDVGEACARQIGLAPEPRTPTPHSTLLRVRRRPALGVVESFLSETSTLASDAFEASAVALWESNLRPGGAEYDKRTEFSLE